MVNEECRWKSQAFACSRVVARSYETRTSAPSSTVRREPVPSVDPVYVVVRTLRRFPSAQWVRNAVIIGASPLRRMNAITRSISSADSISARICAPTRGSPGAFVRRVVSSSGISG